MATERQNKIKTKQFKIITKILIRNDVMYYVGSFNYYPFFNMILYY